VSSGEEALGASERALWRDDKRVLRWLADHRAGVEANVAALRRESIAEQVLALGSEDPSAVVTGVLALLARLPQERREAAVASLRHATGGVAW
jgi:hypothetical protein